jgi:hypothetical protein
MIENLSPKETKTKRALYKKRRETIKNLSAGGLLNFEQLYGDADFG